MKDRISYRIVNDGGKWLVSRPWHVESDIGFGWGRRAVCLTESDAKEYIKMASVSSYEEDAIMLGNFND